MPTIDSALKAAFAWVAGEPLPAGSPKPMIADGDKLLDYGQHYVTAYRADGGVYLNESDYLPTDIDRFGWEESIFRATRRPKYSPTTRRHVQAVRLALQDEPAGTDIPRLRTFYTRIPGRTFKGPNGHDYSFWTEHTCEWCEEAPALPGQSFCSAECREEARADRRDNPGFYDDGAGEVYDDYSDADPGL
jgi:hypothetical protein